jgi:hypothetical protein
LELLWDRCSGEDAVDDTIYDSFQHLPEKLEDIYQACRQKIHQDERKQSLANKAMELICAAVEPFQVSQLQEALVIDPKTGEPKSGPIHRDELLACCSSFVYTERDGSDDIILLAHYSVRQFLYATMQTDHDTAQLQLGELCINHLHRHMPVQDLTVFGKDQHQRVTVPIPTTVISSIASAVVPRLFSRSSRSLPNRVAQIRLPVPTSRVGTSFERKGFLYYAKEHWTSLTRHITTDSASYSKFKAIALFKSKMWWIYPWQRYYDSDTSHVSAIYGWSIMNSHFGLFALAIDQQSCVDKSIYGLPLFKPLQKLAMSKLPNFS